MCVLLVRDSVLIGQSFRKLRLDLTVNLTEFRIEIDLNVLNHSDL